MIIIIIILLLLLNANKQSEIKDYQIELRRNMSTSLALMELTEEITTALDDKKSHCGCLY